MRVSLLWLALGLTACGVRRGAMGTDADAAAGRREIIRLGCGSCHTIPGIAGAHGRVGPSLEGIASHSYVAGELPNQPLNLEHWIQHPHSIHRDTMMPEVGMTDTEAQEIAAYLYSLK